MSAARVLNPIVLSEFCKIRPSPTALSRELPCGRQLNRIKRDLFGVANAAETKKIFTETQDKHHELAARKWGFDFRAGVPANNSASFKWERVSFGEACFIPEMYTLTRAAHVRPQSVPPTDDDVLMDERSDRENMATSSPMGSDESCNESSDKSSPLAFKVPATADSPCESTTLALHCNGAQLRKRQPKITEYMKERKRLAQLPKKMSPVKRMRLGSPRAAATSPPSVKRNILSDSQRLSPRFSVCSRSGEF